MQVSLVTVAISADLQVVERPISRRRDYMNQVVLRRWLNSARLASTTFAPEVATQNIGHCALTPETTVGAAKVTCNKVLVLTDCFYSISTQLCREFCILIYYVSKNSHKISTHKKDSYIGCCLQCIEQRVGSYENSCEELHRSNWCDTFSRLVWAALRRESRK